MDQAGVVQAAAPAAVVQTVVQAAADPIAALEAAMANNGSQPSTGLLRRDGRPKP